METLERSRVCRLCGKEAVMRIDIFGKHGNHVKKINMVLPILVHEMDLLPKHMCHPCNYKLQEFHKFYEDCSKTDANLKSQLSWMQGTADIRDEMIVPMVQINNVKIKTESYENYDENHYTNFHEKFVEITDTRCPHCGCYCNNRNFVKDRHSSDDFSRSTIDEKRDKSIGNIAFSSKDMIKRNLFATQIFPNKSPRVRLENTIGKDSKRFFNENGHNELPKFAEFDRSDSLENEKPIMKIADISSAILPRTLRPRNNRATLDYHRLSSIKSAKRIRKKMVKIKPEAREEHARNLRPRKRTIYYSDSKREYAMIEKHDGNTREMKRMKESLDDSKVKNIKKEANYPMDSTKMNIECPSLFFTRKNECEEFKERRKCRSNMKNENTKKPFRSRNKGRKMTDLKGEIVNGDIIADNYSDGDKKRDSSKVRVFNEKIADDSKRANNSRKNDGKLTFRLRSQVGLVRSKEIRLVVVEPKLTKRRKLTGRKKKLRDDTKNSVLMRKYHVCEKCKKRFPSHELYRLHGCYNERCR